MTTNKVTGLIMATIILVLLGGIAEQAYLPAGQVSNLQKLLQPTITQTVGSQYTGFLGLVVGTVNAAKDWFGALWTMLWFNYPFMTGAWGIVRYILWLPVSIGIVLGIIQIFAGKTVVG